MSAARAARASSRRTTTQARGSVVAKGVAVVSTAAVAMRRKVVCKAAVRIHREFLV